MHLASVNMGVQTFKLLPLLFTADSEKVPSLSFISPHSSNTNPLALTTSSLLFKHMALVPPPNLAGIPLPPNPPVPPSFGDIARASQYLDGLTWTRTGKMLFSSRIYSHQQWP